MGERRTILGIDIGGTKVCLALVSDEGALLSAVRYPIAESPPEKIPETLFAHADDFLAANPRFSPGGIGIGLKAMVGPGGEILRSSILGEIMPFDLRGALSGRYHLPAALDNDVHAAALAEVRFGAGRDHRDFVYVNIGTGAAAGIVSDGKLIRGHRNCAGELGVCLCFRSAGGPPFPLESVVSGKGLGAEAARLGPAYPGSPLSQAAARGALSGREVLAHFDAGDPLAKAVMEGFLEAASLALIDLSLLVDPSLFVLGGGVLADGRMLKRIEDRVASDCARYGVPWAARIEPSPLGADEAGVLGAAAVWLSAMEEGAFSQ